MTYVLLLEEGGRVLYADEELAIDDEVKREALRTVLKKGSGNLYLGGTTYSFQRVELLVGGRTLHLVKLFPVEDTLLRVFSTLIHEFKNPLGALRALTQALGRRLERYSRKEEVQRYIDMMIKEIDRINALVGSFKFLSRPTIRYMVEFNLTEVVREVVALYGEEFFIKGVILEMKGQEKVLYLGNPDDFHQITANLLKNALEATEKGDSVQVKLSKEGKKVLLEVEDTGVGIEEEVLQRLRRGEIITTKATGMGMGLYVVNHLLKRYKGTLQIQRRPKGGTTVRVELPLREKSPL